MDMNSISKIFYEKLIIDCYMINFSNCETKNFIQKKIASSYWGQEELISYFDKNFTDVEMKLNKYGSVINLVNDRDVENYVLDNVSNRCIVRQWLDMSIYTLEGRVNHYDNEIDIMFKFIAPKNVQMKELIKRVNVNSLKKIYITQIEKNEECWLHG
ncbi:hypothetical protein [Enterococcus faecalis]|uniref:hypothetical protein n=1 Tax=Enterococcus faecalis TaxID=1351 RepID=UPI00032E2719|nr:hypothetical protein [Enterococcus faecalis]EOJ65473.1 hypothetical protein WMM_00344 [Enterococcus faecalis EnGen0364]